GEGERPAHCSTLAKDVDNSLSLGVHLRTLQIRQASAGLGIEVGGELRLRICDQRRQGCDQNYSPLLGGRSKGHMCFLPPLILLPSLGDLGGAPRRYLLGRCARDTLEATK